MTNRNRLIELINHNQCYGSPVENGVKSVSNEALAENFIANGIIVPPCKVGDIVFTSYDHIFGMQTNEILTCRVVFIGFGENGNYINIVDNYGHMHSMSFEEFDKTVFFTRKEAEKALKQSKNNVNGE